MVCIHETSSNDEDATGHDLVYFFHELKTDKKGSLKINTQNYSKKKL